MELTYLLTNELHGLSSPLDSSYYRTDTEEDAKERTKYLFKKCIISTRIALKSFDNVLNDIEEESNKDEFIGNYLWPHKELVMHNRITLPGLVDSIIKNLKKFAKLERILA